jgi:hypothetical protein
MLHKAPYWVCEILSAANWVISSDFVTILLALAFAGVLREHWHACYGLFEVV